MAKRSRRVIGVTVSALLAAFLGLELNLRWWGGPIEIFNPLNGFHEGDPELGWRGRAGILRRFHTNDFDVLVEHDERGFRKSETAPTHDATHKVLFLGDSLAWGWGVGQGEVFSDHLQRTLGPEIAIYNRAVNAYSTGQELLLLRRLLAGSDSFDLVVLFVSRTDIGDNADSHRHRPGFYLEDGVLKTRNQPPPGALKNTVEKFIDDHSHATNFLSWQLARLKRWLQPRSRTQESGTPENDAVEHSAKEPIGSAITQRLLEEIAELCRKNDVPLLLAYVSADGSGSDDPIGLRFRRLVARIAQREKVAYLDLDTPLRKAQQRGEEVFFPFDRHWNENGHRHIAELLVRSQLLLPRRLP